MCWNQRNCSGFIKERCCCCCLLYLITPGNIERLLFDELYQGAQGWFSERRMKKRWSELFPIWCLHCDTCSGVRLGARWRVKRSEKLICLNGAIAVHFKYSVFMFHGYVLASVLMLCPGNVRGNDSRPSVKRLSCFGKNACCSFFCTDRSRLYLNKILPAARLA